MKKEVDFSEIEKGMKSNISNISGASGFKKDKKAVDAAMGVLMDEKKRNIIIVFLVLFLLVGIVETIRYTIFFFSEYTQESFMVLISTLFIIGVRRLIKNKKTK